MISIGSVPIAQDHVMRAIHGQRAEARHRQDRGTRGQPQHLSSFQQDRVPSQRIARHVAARTRSYGRGSGRHKANNYRPDLSPWDGSPLKPALQPGKFLETPSRQSFHCRHLPVERRARTHPSVRKVTAPTSTRMDWVHRMPCMRTCRPGLANPFCMEAVKPWLPIPVHETGATPESLAARSRIHGTHSRAI